MMDVGELISEVRRLEIRTRRVVDDLVGGAYRSRFKGRGIEFEEVREYAYGDDVRDIDWNVSARMGAPFVKKYVEERELQVVLAADVSASGLFGSGAKTKLRTQAEIAALLSLSAVRNRDKVGMITFSDRVEKHLPVRGGRAHVLRMLRELVATEPRGRGTNLAEALTRLRRSLKRRSVIFVISDFLDSSEGRADALGMLARRHDVVLVRTEDPAELAPPFAGTWNLADAETPARGVIHGNARARGLWAETAARERDAFAREAARAGAGLISVRCGEDLVRPFVKFFRER